MMGFIQVSLQINLLVIAFEATKVAEESSVRVLDELVGGHVIRAAFLVAFQARMFHVQFAF